jgi:hypothetical protein
VIVIDSRRQMLGGNSWRFAVINTHDDLDYFTRRAFEERSRAAKAADPCVRQTHLLMAAEYERLTDASPSMSQPKAGLRR